MANSVSVCTLQRGVARFRHEMLVNGADQQCPTSLHEVQSRVKHALEKCFSESSVPEFATRSVEEVLQTAFEVLAQSSEALAQNGAAGELSPTPTVTCSLSNAAGAGSRKYVSSSGRESEPGQAMLRHESFCKVTGERHDGVPSGQQSQHGHVIELVPSSIPAEAFDKLGGWDALIMVVSKYFDALAADPLLSFVFAHVDRSTYVRKLSLFLGHAVLGKLPYDARTLWIRHKHLIHNHGIGVAHVDRMIQILAGTLESVNAPPDVIRDARELYTKFRWVFETNVSFAEEAEEEEACIELPEEEEKQQQGPCSGLGQCPAGHSHVHVQQGAAAGMEQPPATTTA